MAASESEAGATSYCKNCKRDIPEQNFQMHEIHCQRNLRLCQKCDEAVPRSEMEDHMEEFHALVECKCKAKIEKSQLEKHVKEDCLQRMVPCKFCEVSLKFSDMPDHEHACGSRTEKCEKCGSYIMIKFAMSHDCSTCKPKQAVRPFPVLPNIGYDYQPVPDGANCSSYVDDLSMDSILNIPGTGESSNSKPDEVPVYGYRRARYNGKGQNKEHFGKRDATRNWESGDRVATDLQGLNIEGRNIRKKVDRSNRRIRPNSDQVTEISGTRKSKVATDDSASGHGLNGFQRDVFPRGRNPQNRDSARSEEVAGGSRRFRPPNGNDSVAVRKGPAPLVGSRTTKARSRPVRIIPIDVEDEPDELSNPVVPIHDDIDVDASNASDDTFHLPCEICETPIPAHELEKHQEICLAEQEDAFRTFHSEVSSNVPITENQEPIVIDEKSEGIDDEPLIPCEFCKEVFPSNSTILHQPYCSMNPQRHQLDESISILNDTTGPSSLPSDTHGFWQSQLDPQRLDNLDPFQVLNSHTTDVPFDTGLPRWGTTSPPFGGLDEDDVMIDDTTNNQGDRSSPTPRNRGWRFDES